MSCVRRRVQISAKHQRLFLLSCFIRGHENTGRTCQPRELSVCEKSLRRLEIRQTGGEMEVENKPQPMAGFAVGILSPAKRTIQVILLQSCSLEWPCWPLCWLFGWFVNALVHLRQWKFSTCHFRAGWLCDKIAKQPNNKLTSRI